MNTFANASPTSAGSRTRNLLTRLTSSFSSSNKPRNIDEFFIHLDDPTRPYSAGDRVRGSIHAQFHRSVSITHLVLSLHGFVKVYKSPTLPGQGVPAEVKTPVLGGSRIGAQYLGNGLVSLFEDEVPLCREGRLTPGRYSFTFETQFPSIRLPSSLDFERGTISYVLVGTLTRPTTISPTLTCELKLKFVQNVDVALLPLPTPQTIILKPLAKRSKSRHVAAKPSQESKESDSPVTVSARVSEPSSNANTSAETNPASPTTSIASAISEPSSSLSFQIAQTSKAIGIDENSTLKSVSGQKVITAYVEMLQGGCLAGDLIPLRIRVKHIRHVRSMHGVIVTLYRKARIDPHPIFPPGTVVSARNSRYDDLLPGSRTGLGGLSLTSSSSHNFRMDLAQAFAPMIVDPITLEAEIKTSVRVPEGLFPTISRLPGDMITFTYHVEVAMDLVGKLANQDRFLPRMNMTSQTPTFSRGSKPCLAGYATQPGMDNYHLIDTVEICRDRSIAVHTFQIIIGTRNSAPPTLRRQNATTQPEHQANGETVDEGNAPTNASLAPNGEVIDHSSTNAAAAVESSHADPPPLIPPPPLDEPMDEKARLRAAEARLLPSAPPAGDDAAPGPSSSLHLETHPSAPTMDDIQQAYAQGPNARYAAFDTLSQEPPTDGESAPAYGHGAEGSAPPSTAATQSADGAAESSAAAAAGEDKQELERQRLLALASSPDDGGSDQEDGVQRNSSGPMGMPEPSAPVLMEENKYGELPSTVELAATPGDANGNWNGSGSRFEGQALMGRPVLEDENTAKEEPELKPEGLT